MIATTRRLPFGRPLAADEELEERLPKVKALSTFSSDNLSSVAYATELIMFTLLAAGTNAFWLVLPISVSIGTIFGYCDPVPSDHPRLPEGGGSHIVAKETLGTGPALVAAAALLTDYVSTVSVSVGGGHPGHHVGVSLARAPAGPARRGGHPVRDGDQPARHARERHDLRRTNLPLPGATLGLIGSDCSRPSWGAHRT